MQVYDGQGHVLACTGFMKLLKSHVAMACETGQSILKYEPTCTHVLRMYVGLYFFGYLKIKQLDLKKICRVCNFEII